MSDFLQLIATGIGYFLFYLAMFAGVVIIPFGIPGEFLIVIAALVFWIATSGNALSLSIIAALLLIGIIAELIEAAAGFIGANQAEGSFWSSFGAIAGGIVGAVVGSFFLPVVGSILGALVGTFGGAYIIEYYRTRTFATANKVATGALIGRIIGSIAKVFCAFLMILIVTLSLL